MYERVNCANSLYLACFVSWVLLLFAIALKKHQFTIHISILKVVLTNLCFLERNQSHKLFCAILLSQPGHTMVPCFISGSSYIENCFVGFR